LIYKALLTLSTGYTELKKLNKETSEKSGSKMKFIYPTNGQELEVAACKLAIRKSFILFREFAQRRFNFLHEPGFGFKCKWECS